MTLFARYYEQRALVHVSMSEMSELIKEERNKSKIADYIFHRYYDRYLKVFEYKSNSNETYSKTVDGRVETFSADVFTEEYKNGFAIMTTCCLLIETVSTFFEGQNESKKQGSETFKSVFKKAEFYGNPLMCFITENSFYKNIRCGLLHQGETYGQFKIRRSGLLYDKAAKTINAKLFCDYLKQFLMSYQQELRSEKWDSDVWDKCRVKLRHIIKNSE